VTAIYQNQSAARRGEGDKMTSTTERRAPNLLRLKEVITKTGLSKNTIYDRIRKKEFPAQIDLGGNCVAWSEDEIDRWIQAKMDARHVNEDGLPKAA
jgi:prophage regulatory protein